MNTPFPSQRCPKRPATRPSTLPRLGSKASAAQAICELARAAARAATDEFVTLAADGAGGPERCLAECARAASKAALGPAPDAEGDGSGEGQG
jgi:hypothetical protein